MGGTRREGALRPRVRAVFFTACFTASRRGSFWNPRLPAQLTASPFPALRHGPSAPSPQCRVPTRAWGGRSQGHGGLWPCPRPTRPRRPAQEGASCLKPHPRHSSQRHPGGISRGAWAGLESKASLPAPAGRAASPGPPCRAVPSRAEPCRAREGPSGLSPASPRRQTHAGRSGAKRGGAAGYRLRCFHHDLTAWPKERGRGVPAGRSVPPGPQGGGCPLPSPSSAVLSFLHTCAWTRTHAHCKAAPDADAPVLLQGAVPWSQAAVPKSPAFVSPPSRHWQHSGCCGWQLPHWEQHGSVCPICLAWRSTAQQGVAHSSSVLGSPTAADPCVGCAHGGRAWVLLVQLCCTLHTPVCV